MTSLKNLLLDCRWHRSKSAPMSPAVARLENHDISILAPVASSHLRDPNSDENLHLSEYKAAFIFVSLMNLSDIQQSKILPAPMSDKGKERKMAGLAFFFKSTIELLSSTFNHG
jgi:hypothetical protein